MVFQLVGLVTVTYGYPEWMYIPFLDGDGYGWDVGEPIAYLIGLGIETTCLIYWLRKKGSLNQSTIRETVLKKRIDTVFKGSRNSYLADKGTLKSRLEGLAKKYTILD